MEAAKWEAIQTQRLKEIAAAPLPLERAWTWAQGGQRLAGAVKHDREHAAESLWSACSTFMGRLTEITVQAGKQGDALTVAASLALRRVVERAMKELEERL